MKNFVIGTVFAALALAATPAMAQSVTLEGRFADLQNNRDNATEYRAQYDNSLAFLKYGVELTTKQGENDGDIGSKIAVKAGVDLDGPLGFKVAPRAEVGYGLRTGDNFEFWGGSVALKRHVIGNVSAEAGYRHRQAFAGGNNFNEERLHGGLTLTLTEKTAINGTYYRTRGTTESDAVGVGVTFGF